MFSMLNKTYSKGLTGIVSDDHGLAVVTVRNTEKKDAVLLSCCFEPGRDDAKEEKVLLPTDYAPGRNICSTLLNIGEYQLLVVDAPEVPPQELRAAVRWKVQDLIDFHIDDAVLDVFDAPPGGPAGTLKQMYVVVARSATVKERIDRLEEAGVKLKIVDIPELAMRNLAARLPEDEFGLVTLYFSQQSCLIILTHNATLFLTRTVEVRFSDANGNCTDPVEFANKLALEIQRSLDYYEQHFHKVAIQTIAILPPPIELVGLHEALRDMLGLKVRTVDLDDIVESDQKLEAENASTCMLAIGCALRAESRAL